MRKKEPKELIEILLRQQRASVQDREGPVRQATPGRKPGEVDPFKGIEWGGLPEELRDKVYRPPQPREALVELLTPFEEEPRVKNSSEESSAEEREEPERPEVSLPERPPWHQRFNAWFFDVFAVLNKTYEVRVATMIAFASGAAFFACLCFLLGSARTQSSLSVYDSTDYVDHSAIIGPEASGDRQEVKNARRTATPGDKKDDTEQPSPKAPTKKPGSSPKPKVTGPCHAIRVTTVRSQEAAENIIRYMRENGLADHDPRWDYKPAEGWIVVVGRWTTRSEARPYVATFEPFFKRMIRDRIIHNDDQLVTPSGK